MNNDSNHSLPTTQFNISNNSSELETNNSYFLISTLASLVPIFTISTCTYFLYKACYSYYAPISHTESTVLIDLEIAVLGERSILVGGFMYT